MPSTPKDFLKEKVNQNLLRMVYPEFFTVIKDYSDSLEFLEDQFKVLGKNIGHYVAENWKWENKYKNLKKLVKELNGFFNDKPKVKIIHKEKNLIKLIDRDCVLCWSFIEPIKIHMCIIIAGFLEAFLNDFSNKSEFPYSNFDVKTIYSRSTGDTFCYHEIAFINKPGGNSQ